MLLLEFLMCNCESFLGTGLTAEPNPSGTLVTAQEETLHSSKSKIITRDQNCNQTVVGLR